MEVKQYGVRRFLIFYCKAQLNRASYNLQKTIIYHRLQICQCFLTFLWAGKMLIFSALWFCFFQAQYIVVGASQFFPKRVAPNIKRQALTRREKILPPLARSTFPQVGGQKKAPLLRRAGFLL